MKCVKCNNVRATIIPSDCIVFAEFKLILGLLTVTKWLNKKLKSTK